MWWHIDNLSHLTIWLTRIKKINVSKIIREDGKGNLRVEAMLASMSIALLVALFLLNSDRIEKPFRYAANV